jgi:AraC-like DNA-binding protein
MHLLSIKYFKPCTALDGLFRSYYLVQMAPPEGGSVTDILPPEIANLRVLLAGIVEMTFPTGATVTANPGTYIIGPTSRSVMLRITKPLQVFGVGIMAPAWSIMTKKSATRFTDSLVDAGNLMGPRKSHDLFQLVSTLASQPTLVSAVDRFLTELVSGKSPPAFVTSIQTQLQQEVLPSIDSMAQALGESQRQLERQCLKAFGLPPKQLLRRHRILEALSILRLNPNATWLEMAGPEFYDQSHFIREFKYFTQMTPTEFAARTRLLTDPALIARDTMLVHAKSAATDAHGLNPAPVDPLHVA